MKKLTVFSILTLLGVLLGTTKASASEATKLAYTVVPTTGMAGAAFSVTVQSQDDSGNPANLASATTITLSKALGGGALSGELTGAIGGGANSVTISTPVYSMADTMTLTATASSGVTLTAITSGDIVFSPGALDHFLFSAISSPQAAGTAFLIGTITAQDANGNTVTGFTGTVDFTESGDGTGGTVTPTASGEFAAGVLSAQVVALSKAGAGVTITATDHAGTTKYGVSDPFTVNPRPTSVVSGSAAICNGGATLITATLTGSQPYSLTWSDGASLSGITSDTVTRSVSPPVTTTYTVTALSDANCAAQSGDLTGSATVSVNTLSASAGAGQEIYAGTSAIIGGSPTASGGTGPYTYSWSPATGLSSATLANCTATPASTTLYSVTVFDAKGCTASASVTVTVHPAPPHEPLGPSSRKTPIVFSEIMYKPAPRADSYNLEFIELYNSNPWFHDISGYQVVCADMQYTFPAGTVIQGGAYLVIAASPQSIQAVYGINNVMGPYTGSLKKSESLQLLDEQGAVLLTVPYSNLYPWPVAALGTGHSIVLANPTYGEGDPRAWAISDIVGGSPGRLDVFHPSSLRDVVINELLAHTEDPDLPDFIELYNHSTQAIDLAGCILTDDATTNKFIIPANTIIVPGGFVSFGQSQLAFGLNAGGETVYLIKPDGSRILDAVQFEAQADGVSLGRWPDGANAFYPLISQTPAAKNSAPLVGDIVINELMYKPISNNDDDQYIELYNKGTAPVSLANWMFTAGISFSFPANTTLEPDSYLVIARNLTNLLAKYPNLNTGNTLGNYGGKLSHNGERVALARPEVLTGTNSQGTPTTSTIYVAQDEVTYGTGGRWGQWANGGGSSLELTDPRANHRLAPNWADSDETQKSTWATIETTGVLDHGTNYGSSIDYAQIGLLDVGECLVDNLEVLAETSGPNLVANPGFESGLANWSLQGDHCRSGRENSGYGSSSSSLHVRASDRIWTGDNSCQMALNVNSLAAGQTATLRFKARWLRGWPEVLLRLNGNWLEATGRLPVPANLGTPGMRNSQYVTNAGPAVCEVQHTPAIPAAGQAVVVTARVDDPDGVLSLVLNYRLDPATSYTEAAMKDDGTGGDAVAGDGLFSATVPGQSANSIVAFYLAATDTQAATTRFPSLLNDNSPARECVVMFGDANPGGSFGVYHLWITQTNVTRWSEMSDLSNEAHDCTVVCGTRVIYNAQGHFQGSPYHQRTDPPPGNKTPYGGLCQYKWIFQDDDAFLGATSLNKLHQPGNTPGDDGTLQREQIAHTFLRSLGVPWLNRRYVAVYVNGNRRGTLMEDGQVPASDVVKECFPNDTDGWLYKFQPWMEFAPQPANGKLNYVNASWCNLMPYTTTGGVKKVAHYRWDFMVRRAPDSANNFTNVFSLVDAASSYGTPGYVANMENLADMENWMRVFAATHAAGCWDSYGGRNSQNVYGYIGALGTKYTLLVHDFNVVLGGGGSYGYDDLEPVGDYLFEVNDQDPNTANIYREPVFRRMYLRALQELINGPFDLANSGPLMDAKYNAFRANGLSADDPKWDIEPWIVRARESIAPKIAAEDTTTFTANTSVVVSNNVAFVSGTAPLNVKTIWFNGIAWPIAWTSVTNWTAVVPLQPGANQFSVAGVDIHGQPIVGDTDSVTAVYNGTVPSPASQVVINEIMCRPSVAGAEYVELYNTSSTITFDLSGWQLQGLSYTFPAGSLMGPGSFLVLAANRAGFAAAYGATIPVFDAFSGVLQADGETLSLIASDGQVVTQVRYHDRAPWPTDANGTGASLQLIDPLQDNWRVGNWTANPGSFTPGTINSVANTLVPFPPLWINELQADNVTGIMNSAGQRSPWLELYNPTANTVSLDGLWLASTYTSLGQWPFPAGATINPGEFKVIFADSQTQLSTPTELHTSFTLPSGSGSLALSRLYNGQYQVLDFIDYSNLTADYSYGSFPDGQSFIRQALYAVTPGGPNDGRQPPSFIAYNSPGSVYAQTFDTLPNPGATSANSDNPITINGITYSLANPFDFAFPVTASGNAGGLGITALAGWYGKAILGTKFGATYGDQTTGGILSFGLPNSGNRAVGLLATSSTGLTAFGVKLVNGTAQTLTHMALQVTGEVWRQSNVPKRLQFYYFIDPTAAAGFPASYTALVPSLDVSFPTVPSATGGVAVDGTSSVNQTNLSVINQAISWLPGAALWLVWQMTDPAGKAQGLGLDNLSFAASDQPFMKTIAGTVRYYDNVKVVAGTLLTLSGDDSQQVTTGGDGIYAFSVPAGGNYTVTASKISDSPAARGVTGADLVFIQRQILGLAPLDSPYKLLAADVNTNGRVTGADLVFIQRVILGLTNTYPVGLWRFVPADYIFTNPLAPWGAPTNRSFTNVVADVANGDVVAIKLGDVNNSRTAPLGVQSVLAKSAQGAEALAKNDLPKVGFAVSKQRVRPWETATVGVTVSGFSQVTSAQFTLNWDPAVLHYKGTGDFGLRGLSAGSFGTLLTESGKLTFVWFDPAAVGVTLADGTVLFTVSFEATGKVGAVSAVALAGSPTAEEVSVDFAVATFGAEDGSVAVVGPGVLVSNPGYANGVFRLSVPTEQGRLYSLEFSDALAPANWTALPAVLGDGTVKVLVDRAVTNQQHFYRVQVR